MRTLVFVSSLFIASACTAAPDASRSLAPAAPSPSQIYSPDAAAASSQVEVYDWKLTAMNGEALPPLERGITLSFTAKTKRAGGNGGCNGYGGSYTLNGSALEFGALMSTMMACENLHLEQRYFTTLSEIKSYEISNHMLILRDSTHAERLRFQRVTETH